MPGGRRIGTYGDRVTRVQGWAWLADVNRCAGVDSARELASHPVSAGLLRHDFFSSVLEDGSDPCRITVGAQSNLVDHVDAHVAFAVAKQTYHHAVWKMLQDPTEGDGLSNRERSALLSRLGLSLIQPRFFAPADMVFPERKPRPLTGTAEWFAELNAQQEFGTLSSIAVLLGLLRKASSSDYSALVTLLRLVTEQACLRFETTLPDGEPRVAWRILVGTRILEWLPQPSVGGDLVDVCLDALDAEFASAVLEKQRGRRRCGPSQAGGRRWRRWSRRAKEAATLSEVIAHQFRHRDTRDEVEQAFLFVGWMLPEMARFSASAGSSERTAHGEIGGTYYDRAITV